MPIIPQLAKAPSHCLDFTSSQKNLTPTPILSTIVSISVVFPSWLLFFLFFYFVPLLPFPFPVTDFVLLNLDKYTLHVPVNLILSKKRSQEKLHKVRGQSDMCHTSVIFMPVFPWQQMGGKFSRRLVSTLSYLLYTHIYAKNFLNVNNFKSTESEISTLLNFEFPNKAEIHCSSLPPQCTTASSLSQRMVTSISQ